jgi:hypothetical protein
MPRHIKPRISRRRLQGQRILDFVSCHQINGNGIQSVTAARKFVAGNSIAYPAVIKVKRNDYTVDSFFYAEKGMFGLTYAEFNWMIFPCLKKLFDSMNQREMFVDLEGVDWASEEESYRPEYSFI